MTNPFENEGSPYHVLINDEGQHSLWPTFKAVPAGWKVVYPSGSRSACLEFIEKNWTDMRPLSLKTYMDSENCAATEVETLTTHHFPPSIFD